ncbi:hypothetical protein [Tahibacter soli]|uniref:Secreted protein n=1 Tax=Tahibacter soli TaxID=2983605 RepID=A0A9X4BJY4_9GAMM|nr:hypothetical protein [Tahibacter soli]MDC8012644.1 hypothetical protein [Tahibacter soli]
MNLHTLVSSAALLLLGVAASPLAVAQPVVVGIDTGGVVVPTGPADALFISKQIVITRPATLVIHYFSECQVERGHVEFDIVVNQGILNVTSRTTAPTNDIMSALCSNDGDTTESNLRAKSVGTVVACTVTTPGDYTVRVRGHVEGPGTIGPGFVDDQSLVIAQHTYSVDVLPCVNELPGT